jgi:hypothetical protein
LNVQRRIKVITKLPNSEQSYKGKVFKYCYSDNRSLWTVMRAGGLAP